MDGAYAPPVEKRCATCGEVKPLSEFYPRKTRKGEAILFAKCKDCENREAREWRAANPDKVREREARYTPAYAERKRVTMRALGIRIKAQVLEHYGTSCACCGITEDLTIDHIAGDGYEHRKALFGSGRANGLGFYRWLIDNDFPPGLQTLCRSCNSSKRRGGVCMMHAAPPTHVTVRELRDRVVACVEVASMKQQPVVVSHRGKPRAVLVSYEEWTALKAAAG